MSMKQSTHDIFHHGQHFIMELWLDEESQKSTVSLTEACDALDEPRPCDWFVNKATVPSWCCNTHQYDGTGDYPEGVEYPEQCPFADSDTECDGMHETHDFEEVAA